MKRPLEGMLVIDFTTMVAGTSCTRFLADCGAEVVKVETPEGDMIRQVGAQQDGIGLVYGLYNAGKKSIVLDLKSPAGLEAAKRLIARADVLVENFRPGVMRRLGLDYATAAALNPQLVFCSISGFGQEGPLADRAAYAPVAHAFSGFEMMMTRIADPQAPPFDNRLMIADMLAGAYAFSAIQTALLHRARNGAGSHVDVTMAEAMMTMVGLQLQQAQVGTDYPAAHFPPFETLDGYVSLPITSVATYRALYRVLGREDWLNDPTLSTPAANAEQRPRLHAAIREFTAQRTSVECDEIMTAGGVPCAIYNMPHEVLDHPHVVARGSFGTVRTASGEFKVQNPPFKISGTSLEAIPSVSKLGADTREVLARLLGYGEDELRGLETEAA